VTASQVINDDTALATIVETKIIKLLICKYTMHNSMKVVLNKMKSYQKTFSLGGQNISGKRLQVYVGFNEVEALREAMDKMLVENLVIVSELPSCPF
jgi:hypothetical protein